MLIFKDARSFFKLKGKQFSFFCTIQWKWVWHLFTWISTFSQEQKLNLNMYVLLQDDKCCTFRHCQYFRVSPMMPEKQLSTHWSFYSLLLAFADQFTIAYFVFLVLRSECVFFDFTTFLPELCKFSGNPQLRTTTKASFQKGIHSSWKAENLLNKSRINKKPNN